MRDFSNDHRWLSINTATVRKQGDLVAIVEACARAGIRAISPWRDQVAAVGLDRAVAAVKDAGLELSGYCRGGMFPADAARLQEARDDNRRAVDEAAALGAPCLVLVVGGLPQYSRPGSAAVEGYRRGARHGRGRHRDAARICAQAQVAARHRAAASDVCGGPRLREHACARRSTSATGSIRSARACSALRSTSIMSGGIRS